MARRAVFIPLKTTMTKEANCNTPRIKKNFFFFLVSTKRSLSVRVEPELVPNLPSVEQYNPLCLKTFTAAGFVLI